MNSEKIILFFIVLLIYVRKVKNALLHTLFTDSLCWHRPIFPGRFQPSIFGTGELNFRVRYGNGWTLTAIGTNFATIALSDSYINQVALKYTLYSLKKW